VLYNVITCGPQAVTHKHNVASLLPPYLFHLLLGILGRLITYIPSNRISHFISLFSTLYLSLDPFLCLQQPRNLVVFNFSLPVPHQIPGTSKPQKQLFVCYPLKRRLKPHLPILDTGTLEYYALGSTALANSRGLFPDYLALSEAP